MNEHNSTDEILHRKEEVEALLRSSSLGGERQRLVNTLYGISNVQKNTIPELDRNDFTYVFFTRPFLNLTDENLTRDRRLAEFLNEADESIQKYCRLLLDTELSLTGDLSSKLLDKNSPFINVFSNTLETMSGWPDEVLESNISEAGMRKEQWGYANSFNKILYEFSLDMTFLNVGEEPIPKIIDLWTNYISNLATGNVMPSARMITRREIDYMSAIYVVVVSNTNKRIKKIARTIGYPVANPKGMYYDYNRSESKAGENKTFSTRFQCFGAEYNDPITLLEFNTAVASVNPEVNALFRGDKSTLVEVPEKYKGILNYRGTPIIDLKYNTLEYLIRDSDFARIKLKNEER